MKAETEIGRRFADWTHSKKTFNGWWHKTVGTQYHKATVDKDFAIWESPWRRAS